jgi:hypothetical protein
MKYKTHRGCKIAHLNCRSLIKYIDQIRLLFSYNDVHILSFNETRLDSTVSDAEVSIPGYSIIRRDRDRKGGGVALYILNSIVFNPVKVDDTLNVEAVSAKVNLGCKSFIISSIYRPPSANVQLLDNITNYMDKVGSLADNMVFVGDFNLNVLKSGTDSNKVVEICDTLQVDQLVKDPTHFTFTNNCNSSTCIDLLFSNFSDKHTVTDVLPVSISDHYMVFSIINFKVVHNQPNTVKLRNFTNFDINAFTNDIVNSSQLRDIFLTYDIDHAWNLFINEYLRIIDKHAPVRVHRVRSRQQPWINRDMLQLMYDRDYLHRKAIKSKTQNDWELYKTARNHVTHQVRQVKSDFIQSQIHKHTGDSRGMWRSLNHVLPSKKNASSATSDLNAEEFNNFFTSIGEKLTSQFDKNILPDMPPMVFNENFGFNFMDINPSFVLKTLKSLSDSHSVDILGIDNKTLKLSSQYIYSHLTHIFNLSLASGSVPADWKRACVTPIYKGQGSMAEASNYRPISITTTISKIFELAVKDQVIEYLDKTDIISPNQSAYLRGRSTQTALHSVIDNLSSNINKGQVNVMCSLDMAKGFDTISHKILLHKLKYYGFNVNSILFFESYLSNRRQIVKYNGNVSSDLPVSIGVPQGSVLGPILFILYVNDLPDFLNCNCEMYADDSTLYCSAPTLELCQPILSSNLSLAEEWLHRNQLVVNASKSCVMVVTNKCVVSENLIVCLNNVVLPVKSDIKLLGLYVDGKLDFKIHIEYLYKKISGKVGLLRRLSKTLYSSQLLLIYKTLIQPHFDYVITIWGSSYSTYVARLQRLQNRCVRIISNNFNFNTSSLDILKNLKLMTIPARYRYFIGILMYKCFNNILPLTLAQRFILVQEHHSYNTRSAASFNYVLPVPRIDTYKRCFLFQGPNIWNKLPLNLRQCTCLAHFKAMYRIFILSNQ